MFELFLSAHLIGAGVMGFSILGSLTSLFWSSAHHYMRWAKILALALGFELVTGSFLAFLGAHEVTLLAFCRNVFMYLLFALGTEWLLLRRMSAEFPWKTVIASMSSGLATATIAVLFAFN